MVSTESRRAPANFSKISSDFICLSEPPSQTVDSGQVRPGCLRTLHPQSPLAPEKQPPNDLAPEQASPQTLSGAERAPHHCPTGCSLVWGEERVEPWAGLMGAVRPEAGDPVLLSLCFLFCKMEGITTHGGCSQCEYSYYFLFLLPPSASP